MEVAKKGFSIGRVAARTGLTVSAIRFYEDKGLVSSGRNKGGQRVFEGADIRRISFILVAQKLGFSLAEIKVQLDRLPNGRTPTKQDWVNISEEFSLDINKRIADLTLMRDKLSSCIGCGCLSLKSCALYNTDDAAALKGTGPRFLMGNHPEID